MKKRSAWKLPFINPLIYNNMLRKKKSITLRVRNILAIRPLLTKKLNIHNGLWYQSKLLTKVCIGHKLGEFSFPRKCDIELHMLKKLRKRVRRKK